ncbi:MAG: hypothetical protein LQ342_001172 [Letrouitia transgressa]|nr:MAG: hypothetical protein LQ342_001172 [Letrouitia transgressa]
MASRYVPPHMRNKGETANGSSTGAQSKPPNDYSLAEICHQFDFISKPGTLNGKTNEGEEGSGKETNGELAFILVFKDQHPEWPPKIFCKSNLHLLPSPATNPPQARESVLSNTDEALKPTLDDVGSHIPPVSEVKEVCFDTKTPFIPLIPIFTQNLRTSQKKARFKFAGYRSISSITYLPPQSKELISMLDAKFTPQSKTRSPESWHQSLDTMWAVVELLAVSDADTEVEKSNPMVPLKKLREESNRAKGVNEMLAEMRLRDEKGSSQEAKVDELAKEGVEGVEGELKN